MEDVEGGIVGGAVVGDENAANSGDELRAETDWLLQNQETGVGIGGLLLLLQSLEKACGSL